LDEAFVGALVEDYEHAPLRAQDRAMLDYVGQLTRDATRITPRTTGACARSASTTAASCRSR
jgi:hypothetical protein